jgi:betaine-aldehyde dehydrogenase
LRDSGRPATMLESTTVSQSGANSYLNYVDGAWVEGYGRETFRTVDPANGEVVSSCQASAPEDVKRAVEAARRSFEGSQWSTDVNYRTAILIKFARFLSGQDMQAAGRLLTRECGKPYKYNLSEYANLPQVFENSAYRARFLMGLYSSPRMDAVDIAVREPIGVVGIIVPWNGPLSLLGRTLAPALAAGTTVVIKPASATAGSTMEFIKMVEKFGEIPKGVVNCVTGSGSTVGAELARNSGVDMVSFTGDVSTGKEIAKLASENVKKTTLELGGKSPNVIFGDADMERAVKDSVAGACFFHAGQICFASTRVLVSKEAHERFLQAFKATIAKMPVGAGLDPRSEIGPVITKSQLSKIMNYIEAGKRDAKLVMGGGQLTDPEHAKGNFVQPTLFDDVPIESKIAQEEIFGPVVTVTPFDDVAEAMRLSNNTQYGLSSMVWTNNLSNAFKVAKSLKAGMVWVNSQPRGSSYFNSFGAAGTPYKLSGTGSMGTVEEYTLGKRIHIELLP